MDSSTPVFPVHHQLPELAQTHVRWVDDAIPLFHPLSTLLLMLSIFPSIRVFSNESVLCITWPKYWSFSFSISPSNEHSGLISFSMDWLDLLAIQGTLKSLLQHHSTKASILQHSAFFIVQLSHPYMTTGKTIALTRWTFVGKVTSLYFNMLSRLVIALLPRSKCLFNFMAAVTICSDQTHIFWVARQILKHWITREFPEQRFKWEESPLCYNKPKSIMFYTFLLKTHASSSQVLKHMPYSCTTTIGNIYINI